jgi:anti-sigma regulatory factor (Ser/Thr protein kinase)
VALIDIFFRTVPATSELSFEFPAHGSSVAEARRRVRAHLQDQGCGDDTCDTAVLLVSELFTNALRHTASATIGCTVRTDRDQLRIEVQDEGRGADDLALGPAGSAEEDGRGLLMVDVLSAGWGFSADGRGQTVWCTLPNDRG